MASTATSTMVVDLSGDDDTAGALAAAADIPAPNADSAFERSCDNPECSAPKLISLVPKRETPEFITEPLVMNQPTLINGFTTVFQVDGIAAKMNDIMYGNKGDANGTAGPHQPKSVFRIVPNTHAHIVNYVVVDGAGETMRKIKANDSETMRKLLDSQRLSAEQMLKKLIGKAFKAPTQPAGQLVATAPPAAVVPPPAPPAVPSSAGALPSVPPGITITPFQPSGETKSGNFITHPNVTKQSQLTSVTPPKSHINSSLHSKSPAGAMPSPKPTAPGAIVHSYDSQSRRVRVITSSTPTDSPHPQQSLLKRKLVSSTVPEVAKRLRPRSPKSSPLVAAKLPTLLSKPLTRPPAHSTPPSARITPPEKKVPDMGEFSTEGVEATLQEFDDGASTDDSTLSIVSNLSFSKPDSQEATTNSSKTKIDETVASPISFSVRNVEDFSAAIAQTKPCTVSIPKVSSFPNPKHVNRDTSLSAPNRQAVLPVKLPVLSTTKQPTGPTKPETPQSHPTTRSGPKISVAPAKSLLKPRPTQADPLAFEEVNIDSGATSTKAPRALAKKPNVTPRFDDFVAKMNLVPTKPTTRASATKASPSKYVASSRPEGVSTTLTETGLTPTKTLETTPALSGTSQSRMLRVVLPAVKSGIMTIPVRSPHPNLKISSVISGGNAVAAATGPPRPTRKIIVAQDSSNADIERLQSELADLRRTVDRLTKIKP